MIAAVVAVDRNWGIGYKNQLLIKNKYDMIRFKNLTVHHKVFVGRKTYDSFPKRPLEKRVNFVITRNPSALMTPEVLRMDNPPIYIDMEGVKYYLSDKTIQHDDYVIGGGSIYEELLPYCDTVYVTKISHGFQNVDTFFPNLDADPEWELVEDETFNNPEDAMDMYGAFDGVEMIPEGLTVTGKSAIVVPHLFTYHMTFCKYIRKNPDRR